MTRIVAILLTVLSCETLVAGDAAPLAPVPHRAERQVVGSNCPPTVMYIDPRNGRSVYQQQPQRPAAPVVNLQPIVDRLNSLENRAAAADQQLQNVTRTAGALGQALHQVATLQRVDELDARFNAMQQSVTNHSTNISARFEQVEQNFNQAIQQTELRTDGSARAVARDVASSIAKTAKSYWPEATTAVLTALGYSTPPSAAFWLAFRAFLQWRRWRRNRRDSNIDVRANPVSGSPEAAPSDDGRAEAALRKCSAQCAEQERIIGDLKEQLFGKEQEITRVRNNFVEVPTDVEAQAWANACARLADFKPEHAPVLKTLQGIKDQIVSGTLPAPRSTVSTVSSR